ncbi:unnamed protein product [Nesidiocoris tenuis]|uniref:Uncharacterized protein n=1 Tax=Nesidiocoris tenuis TaxID=355587 RepID=A0A6H5HID4_9HEMI|nr:unnamed protein product [Nesidiocoris tenuis]
MHYVVTPFAKRRVTAVPWQPRRNTDQCRSNAKCRVHFEDAIATTGHAHRPLRPLAVGDSIAECDKIASNLFKLVLDLKML